MGCINYKNTKENAANVPVKRSTKGSEPKKKSIKNNNFNVHHTRIYNNFLTESPPMHSEVSDTPNISTPNISTPNTFGVQRVQGMSETMDQRQKNMQNIFRRAFYEQEKDALRIKLTQSQELKLYEKNKQYLGMPASLDVPGENVGPVLRLRRRINSPPADKQPKSHRPVLEQARTSMQANSSVQTPTLSGQIITPHTHISPQTDPLAGIRLPEIMVIGTTQPPKDNIIISDWIMS